MRKMVIVGNWKMHKNAAESVAFVKDLKAQIGTIPENTVVGVAPTMLALAGVIEALKGSGIQVGAQAAYPEAKGAFTGQVAMEMVKQAGANFCIIGHSEQRQFFGETDETVKKRTQLALSLGLTPIVCIGETLEERESGKTESVLETQITKGLSGIEIAPEADLVLAYEPVWAIGTGKTATPEMAQDAHAFSRKVLAKVLGNERAAKTSIQYGGSVKADNAKVLLGQEDIDGALIGGASLELNSFISIIHR